MANTSTTAEQLVILALEKIDINTQEHPNFCIVEKTVGETGMYNYQNTVVSEFIDIIVPAP